MAGSRGQFFTVSEAILDKESDCEDYAWDGEDDVDTATLPSLARQLWRKKKSVLALRHLNVNMPQVRLHLRDTV
jgi:hypothetical protein